MQELYRTFFKTCEIFDKFVQEQKWKLVKNKGEFKTLIESEFCFWKRIIEMLPPERRLLKEFKWLEQCYEQIMKNLANETINWKLRWLKDDDL
jgi:hypothetical protein